MVLVPQASPPARAESNQEQIPEPLDETVGPSRRGQAGTPALPARWSLIIFTASAVEGSFKAALFICFAVILLRFHFHERRPCGLEPSPHCRLGDSQIFD